MTEPLLICRRSDWAYVEDWCRRLTGNFSDVYVFTVPLYLPHRDADGKHRVVRALSFRYLIPILKSYDRRTRSLVTRRTSPYQRTSQRSSSPRARRPLPHHNCRRSRQARSCCPMRSSLTRLPSSPSSCPVRPFRFNSTGSWLMMYSGRRRARGRHRVLLRRDQDELEAHLQDDEMRRYCAQVRRRAEEHEEDTCTQVGYSRI